ALKHGRQEAVSPVGGALLRVAAGIGDRDVGRKVLVLGAERVAHPCAGAGKSLERESGAHEHFAGPVSVRLRGQRMDEAHLVGAFGQMGQQVRDPFAAFTALAEGPWATREVAVFALERDQLVDTRQRLAVALPEGRLVVPGVEVADSARTEDVQDATGPGGKMR